MNRRARGNKTEQFAVQLLESQGFITYRVPGSRLYQKNQDIFHLFDILAVINNSYKLIQIKTNQMRDINPHRLFAKIHRNEFMSFEVWIYNTRKRKWRMVVL